MGWSIDMILNPWDVESKQIHTVDGTSFPLYAGECRWGGGELYVLVRRTVDDISKEHRTADGK